MRYDDWDVILFPRDSHVPIQEFKTACYVAPDEGEFIHPVMQGDGFVIMTIA